MKKWIIAGFIYFFSFSQSWAQPFICPFTDYFLVDATSPAQIVSLSVEGNIIAKQVDSSNFLTNCKSNTSVSNGHVYVTLQWPDNSVCTLHILDGPYEMNPSVVFNHCSGRMIYSGIDHVWGTYNYSLKFIE